MSVQLDMEMLARGETPTRRELLKLVVGLSTPAILAEFAMVAMEYIDAAMVGSLGPNATAAVGMVASATWLLFGLALGATIGFSVQIAQHIGAAEYGRARNILRQAIVALGIASVVLGVAGALVSDALPVWLGAQGIVAKDASAYFMVFSLAMPAFMYGRVGTSALQCAGDMRTPSILAVLSCALDVGFNFLLIFPERTVDFGDMTLTVPGANLGVPGASLGTGLSEVVVASLLMWFACRRSPILRLWGRVPERYADDEPRSWRVERRCLKVAAKTAYPICIERVVMNGAQMVQVAIIAPLDTVAIAAHTLANTAEGLCYMPGFGVSSAATTLVGQSVGAGRSDLARRFGRMTTYFGMGVMAVGAIIMYVAAPALMGVFTPDVEVQALATQVLRIVLFIEPLFGASIVAAGAMRGAGDTLIPSIMNMATMWGLRIVAAGPAVAMFDLPGMWGVMAIELAVRGTIFLVRLHRGRWLNRGSLVAR